MTGKTKAAQAKTLSLEEAAAELGIGRTLAYRLAAEGKLPVLRLGGRILVPRAALDAFMARTEDRAEVAD